MKRVFFPLAVFLWILSCRMVNISNDLLEVRKGEHSVDPGGTLVFNNTNGDLELTEWDRDYIEVQSSIYGDSARGIPEDLNINVEETDSRLEYTIDYPGGLSFVSVDFSVQVPENSGYIVKTITVNGDTEISAGVTVSVESVNGDISVHADECRGIETVNGDIEAVLLLQRESFQVEAVNGDISVEIPEDLGVVVETLSGDIIIDGEGFSSSARVPGECSRELSVDTVNGDVEVTRVD